MAKQPETILKQRVLADLRAIPDVYAVKIQQVAIRGTLDIFACAAGNFIALELKQSDKEKPDPLQAHEITKIRNAGGYAFVVTPSTWPEILEVITFLARSGAIEHF